MSKVTLSIIALKAAVALACLSAASAQAAGDCGAPRFAETGWSDLAVVTRVATTVLEGLGYRPSITMVSTDIAYLSLANNDLDITMGTWLPGLASMSAPYRDAGKIQRIGVNLEGAMETIAVPDYVYDAGVTSLATLVQNRDRFQGKIFGVEPGGNLPQIKLIEKNVDGMGSFTLVETSEAAMLAHVQDSVAKRAWVAFHAWSPHPMNRRFPIRYLSGGEEVIGADFGASIVTTDARAGFVRDCPDLAQLLGRMRFTPDEETGMMARVVEEGVTPERVATDWLRGNRAWTARVVGQFPATDGGDGLAAVETRLGK